MKKRWKWSVILNNLTQVWQIETVLTLILLKHQVEEVSGSGLWVGQLSNLPSQSAACVQSSFNIRDESFYSSNRSNAWMMACQGERITVQRQECWPPKRTAGTMQNRADGGKKKKRPKKRKGEAELQPVTAIAALCWIHDCRNIMWWLLVVKATATCLA